MRQAIRALIAISLPTAAMAQQSAPITATPLQPPAQHSSPQTAQPAPDQTQNTLPGPAGPQPTQLAWQPRTNALLQVLDKVNAQNAVLTVKVGQQAQYGSLSIQVQACDIRPADQPPDSAAYLTITDSHPDIPGFRGWMLAGNPSVSMLQHPIYDVRVIGCRT